LRLSALAKVESKTCRLPKADRMFSENRQSERIDERIEESRESDRRANAADDVQGSVEPESQP
jgi:hypothetical protein